MEGLGGPKHPDGSFTSFSNCAGRFRSARKLQSYQRRWKNQHYVSLPTVSFVLEYGHLNTGSHVHVNTSPP